VANDWETLVFDFANPAAGTPPLNLANTYNKVSIFFNFGVPGAVAGEKIYFFDDVAFGGAPPPPPSSGNSVIIDDFEDGQLPTGQDPNGIQVGFLTASAPGASVAITITDTPPAPIPGAAVPNNVLQEDLTLGVGQWAVFVHNFTNDAADAWVPQDWTSYEGFSLWLYGNNTGGTIFLDILDNRNPGSTTDDAERWSLDIPDTFSGWQYFQFSWDQFNRKDIGNGAPNDGFTLTEVHGYAVGGYGNVNMGSQSYYIDDVAIFGNTGGIEEPLQVQFARNNVQVAEGDTAVVTVTLNMTSTAPVSISYITAEGFATPDRNYVPTSGELVIAPGELEQTFTVTTLRDGKPSGDQRLMLNLRDPDGAEAGFRLQAMLTILDIDPVNPTMVDDFQGFHRFAAVGDVELSITELAAGSAMALPGQGAYEDVLTGVYGPAGGSFTQTYPVSRDWSGYNGLSFWYYGSNSGQPITVNLLDNQTTTTAQTPPGQWQLVWSDEFDDAAGTGPNPNVWSHEIGDGTMNGIPGWGNSELEFYTDSLDNAATDGSGNLAITLDEADPAQRLLCWYGPCEYTSARLISADKIEAEFGRIEARILVPDGAAGLWPAFWMLGTNIGEVGWPQSGEIDIMEYVSRNPFEVFGTIHGPGYSGGAAFGNTYTFPQLVAESYHTFNVEWSPDEIQWYVDGINYHTATPADVAPNEWVFNHPFYLIMNLAIGGNFGGTVSPDLTFPQQMLVDYVRIYQAPNTSERFEASFVDNFSGWRKVTVPFSSFSRSAEQPAGAPNDGLGLNQVWGYGMTLPAGSSGTFHMDQVQLARIPTVPRSRRFNVDSDTFINGAQPGVAFGSAQTMWVGFFDQMRPVVHAPIAGIPSDAEIDAAYLYLYIFEGRGFTQWSNSVISNVAAHVVTTPWVSETATWWTPWNSPGGDYGPAVGANHVGSGKINTWLRLDVTEAVRDIVTSGANNGILLTSNDSHGVRYGLAASEYFDPSKSGYIRVYFRTVD
jgi:beta-glucanase (GH16 family)